MKQCTDFAKMICFSGDTIGPLYFHSIATVGFQSLIQHQDLRHSRFCTVEYALLNETSVLLQ